MNPDAARADRVPVSPRTDPRTAHQSAREALCDLRRSRRRGTGAAAGNRRRRQPDDLGRHPRDARTNTTRAPLGPRWTLPPLLTAGSARAATDKTVGPVRHPGRSAIRQRPSAASEPTAGCPSPPVLLRAQRGRCGGVECGRLCRVEARAGWSGARRGARRSDAARRRTTRTATERRPARDRARGPGLSCRALTADGGQKRVLSRSGAWWSCRPSMRASNRASTRAGDRPGRNGIPPRPQPGLLVGMLRIGRRLEVLGVDRGPRESLDQLRRIVVVL
jgi:hypothetical protein